MEDIKALIDKAVKKLQSDPKLLEKFKTDPVKTLEGLTGLDLPDDKLQPVVDGIKAKMAAGDFAGEIDKLKKLF